MRKSRRNHRAGALITSLLLSTGLAGAAPRAVNSAYLPRVGYVAQTYNNCGPASLIAVMQHYGLTTDQKALGALLRPHGGYMPITVINPFLGRIGLTSTYYRKGQLVHVRRLLAAGVPVIVLQWLDDRHTIPHFRVARGFDDRSQTIYVSDPMKGPNYPISYARFESLWSVGSNTFLPVYPPNQAQAIRKIIGS